MSRWTQYDEDGYRLPEGMTRIGYDSDAGRYRFRDKDGSIWEGPEGAEYGEMRKVSHGPVATDDEDVESGKPSHARSDGYSPLPADAYGTSRYSLRPSSPYRTLFPFVLLVAVTLLLVFRLVGPIHTQTSANACPEGSSDYYIKSGDTCWQISKTYGCSLDRMLDFNSGLNCDALRVGEKICVPYPDK